MLLNAVLRHSLAASAAAAKHGLQATIDLPSFTLMLHGGGQPQAWRARFITLVGAVSAYTEVPMDATVGFAGWLPYAPRRWPEGSGKSAFRRHALATGLPMLPGGIDQALVRPPFLVKSDGGSFGQGQRGPFAGFDPFDPSQRLREGECYESFVPGLSAKAWCWGGRCVALDLQRPPTVTGDGRSTLQALALAAGPFASHDLALLGRLGAFCGVGSVHDVVPEGRSVLVHYRYGADPRKANGIAGGQPPEPAPPGVQEQFAAAAERCVGTITAAGFPAETLYTLDAVIDGEGSAHFLEMNCCPMVHPDAYDAMLASAVARAPAPAQRERVPEPVAA